MSHSLASVSTLTQYSLPGVQVNKSVPSLISGTFMFYNPSQKTSILSTKLYTGAFFPPTNVADVIDHVAS